MLVYVLRSNYCSMLIQSQYSIKYNVQCTTVHYTEPINTQHTTEMNMFYILDYIKFKFITVPKSTHNLLYITSINPYIFLDPSRYI